MTDRQIALAAIGLAAVALAVAFANAAAIGDVNRGRAEAHRAIAARFAALEAPKVTARKAPQKRKAPPLEN